MAKGQYHQWETEEGQLLLRGWRRQGMTDEQIAKKIGIACSTLYEWKKKRIEIAEALKKGKQLCDFEAEEALISMFSGHTVEETWTEIDEVDGRQRKRVKKVKRWVDPNTTAIIFYLKCRAGWREQAEEDKHDIMQRLAELSASVRKEADARLSQHKED